MRNFNFNPTHLIRAGLLGLALSSLGCGQTSPMTVVGPVDSTVAATDSVDVDVNTVSLSVIPTITGISHDSLLHDGLERTYSLYVPSSYSPSTPMSLLMVFHGAAATGEAMMTSTDFNRYAETENFIVVYPDGLNRTWNTRDPYNPAMTDDLGFTQALIEHMQSEYSINAEAIFASGMSNGGVMSYLVACELSDTIAAIAPVAANFSMLSDCAPSAPVSIQIFHGTSDPLVPYDGGNTATWLPELLSMPDIFSYWGHVNDCQQETISSFSRRVTRHHFNSCTGNTAVELYTIDKGSHQWFRPWSSQISATATIMEFFKSQVAHPI